MEAYPRKNTIKFWAEEDRPREKLLLKGRQHLSDSELIAILLGSGTKRKSALELAREILDAYEGDINRLARAGIKDLMRFPGIGEAKAVGISAAIELGTRRKPMAESMARISTSQDAYLRLGPILGDLGHEEFWVIFLNQANKVLKEKQISKGGLTGTVADPRMIFKLALDEGACSIILAHNHPSHSLKASQADLDITRKLSDAGKALDIRVIDHLIITQSGYVSFADEGWI
jgi:DNA repair protein RadC